MSWNALTTDAQTGGEIIESYNLQYAVGSSSTYTDI